VTGAVDRIASVNWSPDSRAKCWLSSACPGSLPVKLPRAAPNRFHSVISQATPFHDHEGFTTLFDIKPFTIMEMSLSRRTVEGWVMSFPPKWANLRNASREHFHGNS
jgi:hypothetical protein